MALRQSEARRSHVLQKDYEEAHGRVEVAAFSRSFTYLSRRNFKAQIVTTAIAFILVFLVLACVSQLSTRHLFVGLRRVRRLAWREGSCSNRNKGNPPPLGDIEVPQNFHTFASERHGIPVVSLPWGHSAGAIQSAIGIPPLSTASSPLQHLVNLGVQSHPFQQREEGTVDALAINSQQLATGERSHTVFLPVDLMGCNHPIFPLRRFRLSRWRSDQLFHENTPLESVLGMTTESREAEGSQGALPGSALQSVSTVAESVHQDILGYIEARHESSHEAGWAQGQYGEQEEQWKAYPINPRSSYASQGARPRSEEWPESESQQGKPEWSFPRGATLQRDSTAHHNASSGIEMPNTRRGGKSLGRISEGDFEAAGEAQIRRRRPKETIIQVQANEERASEHIKSLVYRTLADVSELSAPMDFFEVNCGLLFLTLIQHITWCLELLSGISQRMRDIILADQEFKEEAKFFCKETEQHIFFWHSTVSAYNDSLLPSMQKLRMRLRAFHRLVHTGVRTFVCSSNLGTLMVLLKNGIITRNQRRLELRRATFFNNEILSSQPRLTPEAHEYMKELRTLSRGMIQLIYIPREIIKCLETARSVTDTVIGRVSSSILNSLINPVLDLILTEIRITALYNPEMSSPSFVAGALCGVGQIYRVVHKRGDDISLLSEVVRVLLHPVLLVAPKRNVVMPYVRESLATLRALKALLLKFKEHALNTTPSSTLQETISEIEDLRSMRKTVAGRMVEELHDTVPTDEPEVSRRFAAVRRRWILAQMDGIGQQLTGSSVVTQQTIHYVHNLRPPRFFKKQKERQYESITLERLARRVNWDEERSSIHMQAIFAQFQNRIYMDDTATPATTDEERHMWLLREVQRLTMPFRPESQNQAAMSDAGEPPLSYQQQQTDIDGHNADAEAATPPPRSRMVDADESNSAASPNRKPEAGQVRPSPLGPSDERSTQKRSDMAEPWDEFAAPMVFQTRSVEIMSDAKLSISESAKESITSGHRSGDASHSPSASQGSETASEPSNAFTDKAVYFRRPVQILQRTSRTQVIERGDQTPVKEAPPQNDDTAKLEGRQEQIAKWGAIFAEWHTSHESKPSSAR